MHESFDGCNTFVDSPVQQEYDQFVEDCGHNLENVGGVKICFFLTLNPEFQNSQTVFHDVDVFCKMRLIQKYWNPSIEWLTHAGLATLEICDIF